MSPRIGRDSGFAKWPRVVEHKAPDGTKRLAPRIIPGRKYMNRRGQWVVPA
jgi:hypothetical protein